MICPDIGQSPVLTSFLKFVNECYTPAYVIISNLFQHCHPFNLPTENSTQLKPLWLESTTILLYQWTDSVFQVLLDLSAAFDTINHNILLSRLNSCFGISNSAHSLLSLYLSHRSQMLPLITHSFPVFRFSAAFHKVLYLVHSYSLSIWLN